MTLRVNMKHVINALFLTLLLLIVHTILLPPSLKSNIAHFFNKSWILVIQITQFANVSSIHRLNLCELTNFLEDQMKIFNCWVDNLCSIDNTVVFRRCCFALMFFVIFPYLDTLSTPLLATTKWKPLHSQSNLSLPVLAVLTTAGNFTSVHLAYAIIDWCTTGRMSSALVVRTWSCCTRRVCVSASILGHCLETMWKGPLQTGTDFGTEKPIASWFGTNRCPPLVRFLECLFLRKLFR